MLAKYYKFKVTNDAGVSVTIQVDWQPFKFDSSGNLVYDGALQTPIASGSVASAGTTTSASIDNTTAKDLGGHLTLYANPGTTPTGHQQILVYLMQSSDNTNFDDSDQALILTFPVTATGVVHRVIEIAA